MLVACGGALAVSDDGGLETGATDTGTTDGSDADSGCDAVASNPKHCGTCGHDCQGGTCSGGVCQPVVLASGQDHPDSIAVDAASIYWTTYTNAGTVMKVAKP